MPDNEGDAAEEVDPRFLLANERTYLAWVRTALGLVGAGFAVIQFVEPARLPGGKWGLGVPLVVLGAAIVLGGYRRVRAVDAALRAHRDLPPTNLPRLLAVFLIIACAVAAALSLLAP